MKENWAERPVAAAVWVVAASLLAGCNDSRISSPDGAARMRDQPRIAAAPVSDVMLPERIRQALIADKSVDAAAISMTVDKGQVVLNGTVPADQITRIDAIVREVAGVKIVINALRPTMPAS